jgi:hypothetical protein
MKCRLHLICSHPFADYAKGQKIIEPSEVKKLIKDRIQHFVQVRTISREPAPASAEA